MTCINQKRIDFHQDWTFKFFMPLFRIWIFTHLRLAKNIQNIVEMLVSDWLKVVSKLKYMMLHMHCWRLIFYCKINVCEMAWPVCFNNKVRWHSLLTHNMLNLYLDINVDGNTFITMCILSFCYKRLIGSSFI